MDYYSELVSKMLDEGQDRSQKIFEEQILVFFVWVTLKVGYQWLRPWSWILRPCLKPNKIFLKKENKNYRAF